MRLEDHAHKKCSRCGLIKSVSKFYLDRQKRDGLTSKCKGCMGIERKKYLSYPGRYEIALAYSKKHHEATKHIKRERTKLRRRALMTAIFNFFGSKCFSCGNQDKRVLQIDHVNGNGYQHRKLFKGFAYYRDIERSIKAGEEKFQLLCANCNSIKCIEKKERGCIWN